MYSKPGSTVYPVMFCTWDQSINMRESETLRAEWKLIHQNFKHDSHYLWLKVWRHWYLIFFFFNSLSQARLILFHWVKVQSFNDYTRQSRGSDSCSTAEHTVSWCSQLSLSIVRVHSAATMSHFLSVPLGHHLLPHCPPPRSHCTRSYSG